MKYFKRHFTTILGFLIIIIFLSINIATINDYGVTWDFTYHFNAGLWHLKKPLIEPNFIMGPSPPLSDILPTLSYLFFFEKLKLFSFDAAYNLYSVVLGSVGIGILYFMVKEIFNWRIALFSSLILGFLPRYFGHLHNNMKDIPQAVFFTLTVWTFWRLYKKPMIMNLLIASASFALAFNSKVNAIFILIIAAIFLLLISLKPIKLKLQLNFSQSKFILLFFLTAPIAALLLWWPFWDNSIGRLLEAQRSYTTSTTNMPILYFGKIFFSGNNVPWHYPIGLLSVTTPTLILFFFLLGLFGLIFDKKITFEAKLFVFIWFLVPLARYLKPQMIVIDDIRHFMEVLFPFAAIAGIGTYRIYLFILHKSKIIFPRINKLLIAFLYFLFFIFYSLFQNLSYHPYQTSYFNELIGGIKGANGKFDIEFWASSYKQALKYLNNNTPYNSVITIPMAPDIAQLYLRPDLTTYLNQKNLAGVQSLVYSQSDYVVILNRQSFFEWYGIYPYIENRKPVYSTKIQNVPLVSIYKN